MKNYDVNEKEIVEYEEEQGRTNALEILWSTGTDGVVLHRVYGNALSLKVPEKIEGVPVMEIGAYCFSASERYPASGCHLSRIRYTDAGDQKDNSVDEKRIKDATMPAICGKYVEEIELPQTVRVISSAAFYNCRNLKKLSVGTALDSMGSDVFMNCIHLKEIIIRGNSEEKTGLSMILERIQTEVEVRFESEKDGYDSVLLFAEYYEWLDEINPAHVFNRRIEGGGFRMRQCFQDRMVQFSKYDQHFPSIITREIGEVICKIALNRLRWPKGLQAEAQEMYRQAVEERMPDAIKLSIQERNLELLEYICSSFKPEQEILSQGIEWCIKADWGEGNVYLMEQKSGGNSFAEKSYDFDEFEDW